MSWFNNDKVSVFVNGFTEQIKESVIRKLEVGDSFSHTYGIYTHEYVIRKYKHNGLPAIDTIRYYRDNESGKMLCRIHLGNQYMVINEFTQFNPTGGIGSDHDRCLGNIGSEQESK